MEALGLGGPPDLKVNVSTMKDAQVVCCVGAGATVNNNRIVFKTKDNSLKEEEPSFFQKICCCCCGKKKKKGSPEENKQAIEMFQQYLKQTYGPLAAASAPEIAGIDFKAKFDAGNPFRRHQFERVTLAARTIQENQSAVQTSLFELNFFDQEVADKSEDVDPFSGVVDFTPCARERLDHIQVVHPAGYTTPFSGRQINGWVKDNVLSDYAFNWQLSKANEFIARVKHAVKQTGKISFTTAEIRTIVYQQLKVMKIKVHSPKFTEHIKDDSVLQSIRSKAQKNPDLSTLSASELTAIIRALQAQSKV